MIDFLWNVCKTVALVFLGERLYLHLFDEVSPKHKCPGCGVRRKHAISFLSGDGAASSKGQILHVCGRCSAAWAVSTVVPAVGENGMAFIRSANEVGAAHLRLPTETVVHATREPQRQKA